MPRGRRLAALLLQLLEQCDLIVGHEVQAVAAEKPQQLPGEGRSEIGVGGKQAVHQGRRLGVQICVTALGQALELRRQLAQGVVLRQGSGARSRAPGRSRSAIRGSAKVLFVVHGQSRLAGRIQVQWRALFQHTLFRESMIPALTIENLRKVYGNGFEALKGISLEVQQGDFFAMLGPNGAGKSTTIGIICSLVAKTAGKVSVFDVDIDQDFAAAKKYIGIVPQEFNFNQFEKGAGYRHQPGRLLRPAARNWPAERAEKYLKALGLWDKRDVPSRMLSGGMKRRLMIARALVHEPRLLILDEPTAGVDIEMRRSMWDFLKQDQRRRAPPLSSPPTTWKRRRPCAAISPLSIMVRSSSTAP